MSLDTVLYTRLTSHSGLSALISTRAYPVQPPADATYPCLSYSRSGGVRAQAMGAFTGLTEAGYQFDVWATSISSLRDVSAQLLSAVDRWRNSSGTVVQDSFIEPAFETFEDVEIATGASARLWRAIHQARIWYEG